MSDIAVLSELREKLTAAENAGDPEPICAAMADDMALMVPNAPVQEGKAACAAFLRAVLPSLLQEFERHVSYTSAEVRVFDETAFDRGTFSFGHTARRRGFRSERRKVLVVLHPYGRHVEVGARHCQPRRGA